MKGGDFSNNNYKTGRDRNGANQLLSKTSNEPIPSYSISTSNHDQSQSLNHPSALWDGCVPFPKLTFPKAALLVFCLSVVCFINSLSGDFVFDDNEAILSNNDLLPETPLGSLFSHDFWGNKLASSTSHKSYRPLTVLTFRLNYYLAGGFHPMGFHLVNILLHGLVSVLFLPVFSILIGGLYRTPEGAVIFQAPRSSALCAVLFAVHPIHTESVSGLVGRADLLCALLFILSFLCYVKSCDTGQPGLSIRPPSYSPLWVLSSLFLCALSVLCKEQGITVIGLCSAYDVIHVCRINIFTIFRKPNKDPTHSNLNNNNTISNSSSKQKSTSDWLRGVIQRHILLFLFGVFLLVVRWKVMGSAPPTFQLMDNPHSFVNGTLLRTLNYNYLYALNCWLLVNPWWLCFDWSMGCVPIITSLTDPRILGAVAFWVILSLLIWSCWKDEIHNNERLLLMSLSVLIIPFLPATNLLFRVGFVVAERVLYLSTAGFCLLLVVGLRHVAAHYPRTMPFLKAGVSFVIVAMVLRSVQRSADWKSEVSLFTAGAAVCPLNAKVHYNIAKVESDRGNGDLAISKYKQAIQLNPNYDQAMNNLGNILKDRGDNQQAFELLSRAVAIRPDFAAAWMNLGIVQAALGKNSEAEQSYLSALKHRRKYPDCLYNLGNLYLDQQRHPEALVAWRNATLQKPTHFNSWSNMMILLTNLDRLDDCETVGKEALRFLPDESNIHYNMANNYGKAQKYADSERHFLQALKLGSSNPGIYANLGVLYHRWNRPAEAERAYLRAIELDPQKTGPGTPRENLEMLYRQKGRGPY